jgi:phosphoribosylpyrophosphate synthetase
MGVEKVNGNRNESSVQIRSRCAWPFTKLSVDDVQVMNLIGDVKGKVAIMVDDMIDTAGMDSSHRIFDTTEFYS